jgi:IMP dehydrogenase
VIHKNLPPEVQAQHVRRVKHYLNGLIMKPVVFRSTDTLDYIRQYREDHHLSFSGFPILDDQDRLVCIVTSSDIRFAKRTATRVSEVMTKNVITAAPGTTLEQAYALMMENKIGKLPLVDGEGRLVGLYAFTDVLEHG